MEPKPKKKKLFDKRSVFFSLIVFMMFLYLAYQISHIGKSVLPLKEDKKSEKYLFRELGNKLKSEKMYDQAAEAYEKYLHYAQIDSESRANIYFTIGELYFENHKYEQALSAYYMADLIGAPAIIRDSLNIKIVNCLERLGRQFSAEYALQSKTSIDKDAKPQTEGVVIAQIGDRNITMRDIDEKLELLDEKTRSEYRDNPQKKFEFLQQFISREVLAKKAQKMGYDKDKNVLERLDDMKKALMVEQMVQNEFKTKVNVTPEDVKLYYEANKSKYTLPASVRIAHILVSSQEKADEILKKIKEGADFAVLAKTESADEATKAKGGEIDGWLSLDPDNPSDKDELIKAGLNSQPGEVAPVIKDSAGYHIVKTIDKQPGREKSFEESAESAARDYQVFKAEKIYGDMVREILQVEGVKINQEAFFGQLSPSTGEKKKDESIQINPLDRPFSLPQK